MRVRSIVTMRGVKGLCVMKGVRKLFTERS